MRDDEAGAAVDTVGERLRGRREAAGLSLDTVAERTRIPIRHLAAIESSDYAALPAAPYAVGFVKSYARLLGEPAEETGRQFRVELDAAGQIQPQQQAFEPADPARVPPVRLAVAALVIAVLFAIGYASWRAGLFGSDNPAARATLAADGSLDRPAPPPAAAPSPSTSADAGAPVRGGPVVITATAPAWLRVSDGDKRLFMGMMKAGDHFAVPTDASAPVIRTAAAQALRITVGDTVAPPLAPPSTLVKDASLRPADLLGRGGQGSATPSAAPTADVAAPTPASDRPLVPHRHRSKAATSQAETPPPLPPAFQDPSGSRPASAPPAGEGTPGA